jgi:hypothetical protein
MKLCSIERILLDGWESAEPCNNAFFVELAFLFLFRTCCIGQALKGRMKLPALSMAAWNVLSTVP